MYPFLSYLTFLGFGRKKGTRTARSSSRAHWKVHLFVLRARVTRAFVCDENAETRAHQVFVHHYILVMYIGAGEK